MVRGKKTQQINKQIDTDLHAYIYIYIKDRNTKLQTWRMENSYQVASLFANKYNIMDQD